MFPFSNCFRHLSVSNKKKYIFRTKSLEQLKSSFLCFVALYLVSEWCRFGIISTPKSVVIVYFIRPRKHVKTGYMEIWLNLVSSIQGARVVTNNRKIQI